MDSTRLPQAPYSPRSADGLREDPLMKRRTFIGVIAGGLLAAPLATGDAQQAGKWCSPPWGVTG
jgi:hypothetical protein